MRMSRPSQSISEGNSVTYKSTALLIYVSTLVVSACALIVFGLMDGNPGAETMVIGSISIVLILYGGFRVARARVEVSNHGVRVRNAFSSRFYDWSEIDEFRPLGGSLDLRAFGSPATLWLSNGSRTYVTSIQPRFLIRRRWKNSDCKVCEELNRYRMKFMAGGGS